MLRTKQTPMPEIEALRRQVHTRLEQPALPAGTEERIPTVEPRLAGWIRLVTMRGASIAPVIIIALSNRPDWG